ncbi:peptidylprolyl isomerase [Acetobacter tropicalis]|uniref:Peptidyl-prolyl cis-trans isomerase n=3 Tax=Acetobacter TaxID=434 RepID=A0A0U5B7H5_9PROT|nr:MULTISPECIES: peptidylprolyl isomerase [Acetobacter]ATJ90353.1 peptidylprolyl isomerase [Acetobacter tropicalis]KAA8389068.1 peptidylprolyl isomerase [Acetobacter tropicalis]KAA8391798.1 peptidylprolyl isomerase [Acetobacter tropicalis]KGB22110.1 Peptidyl-prolyl cis-trans isomerase [Acetobacter tropicalis]KXV50472.1 peptidylprolyl isomerase [Acetobacter tropicalis]
MSTETDKNDLIYMDVPAGRVVIRLRPDIAPLAAERIRTLSAEGFYDNVPFHRVIEGFMAQAGDPTGTGTGGSPLPDLKAEFTRDAKFLRGTLGMARTSDPNSANSQFFIMFEPSPHLDGQYTIVGDVIEGMENIDKIKRGGGASGMVREPDRIIKMRPASSETA